MNLREVITSEKEGTFVELFPQFDPSTIQHSDEIITSGRRNEELMGKPYLTADCPIYTPQDGGTLYLARGRNHPLLTNMPGVIQLYDNGLPIAENEGLRAILEAEDTLRIKL